MVLTLYKMEASPPARSVLMVIKAANIPNVEYVDMNLLTGDHLKDEYQKMNPQHTIPTLKDDDFAIWDSHAIAVYLITKYSNNKTLYPTDPKKRAIIDQRLHFDSGILFPSLRGAVAPIIYKGERSFSPEALEKIRSGYELAEKILTKPWMTGSEITLADICCVATISSLNELLPIDPKAFPNITAWFQLCKGQDFYKANEPGNTQLGDVVRSKLQ